MADEPIKDAVEEILIGLRDEQTAIREQAINRLQVYFMRLWGNVATEAEMNEEYEKA